VGLRNAGGAYADNEDSDEPSAFAEVRLPEGLSVVGDAPCGQARRSTVYRCALTVDSMPGDRHVWTFRVRVDERVPDAAGSVTVADGTVRDGVSGNNQAVILANPSVAPTPSGSVSPSASAVPSGSASPSGPAGPGKLPVTGSSLGLLVMTGLLALGAGGLLYAAARRRRRGVPGEPVAE
jgi:LPXTG-motif cell wall-anchored protein